MARAAIGSPTDQLNENLAIAIPVRVDKHDRLENLNASLRFLEANFAGAEFIVCEDARVPTALSLAGSFPSARFEFTENADRFCKARVINRAAALTKRPVFVLWDLDVFVRRNRIAKGAKLILQGSETIVLPHNCVFVNAQGETRRRLIETLDCELVPYVWHKRQKISNDDLDTFYTPSGVVMFNREVLLLEGGFNTSMVSYGWQDVEVLKRFSKLGYYPRILGGSNVIHLHHERSADSGKNEYFETNKNIFFRVRNMSRTELSDYIDQELADKASSERRLERRRKQARLNRRRAGQVRYTLNRAKYFLLRKYF